MNRRSLLTMLGLAPLVAACGPKPPAAPIDGLMKDSRADEVPIEITASYDPGVDDTTVGWLVKWGDDRPAEILYSGQKPLREIYQWREFNAAPRKVIS